MEKNSGMEFTGERFVPEKQGNIELEHLHRYYLARPITVGKIVLDIASGEGYGSSILAEAAAKVVGVDISREAILHARVRYARENLEYLVGNCAEIPLPDASVDVIVSFETIEHHDQHDQMMKEIKRVLRQDGVLIVSSPDKYFYSIETASHNPHHVKELYEHEFKKLLGQYFSQVTYYGQRVLFGSAIFAESVQTSISSYSRDNQTSPWKASAGVSKPHYWIAVASDLRAPELTSGMFEQAVCDAEPIRHLNQTITERDDHISTLTGVVAEYGANISDLTQNIVERDNRIGNLAQYINERDQQITNLNQEVLERDRQIASLNEAAIEFDRQIAGLSQIAAEREGLIAEIHTLLTSTSWKITAPIRAIGHRIKRIKHLLRILPGLIHRGGGIWATTQKTAATIRREGLGGVKRRIHIVNALATSALDEHGQLIASHDYAEWVRRYDTLDDAARIRIHDRINAMPTRPKISVIMPVYNPPLEFLDKAIWSVRNQLYPQWELCIADDASPSQAVRDLLTQHAAADVRIHLVFRTENGHISKASNSALEIATGEFIAMLDHDDQISEHALYLAAEALNQTPTLDFLYSDQDKIDTNGVRYDPYFKPDFNPDLLRSQNYVDHLAVFRTSLVRELGGWRPEFDGSQDYDLALRVTEKILPSQIGHIPHVLYHWRAVPGSLAIDASAKSYAPQRSREALADHIKRLGLQAEVTSHYPHFSIHRVIYSLHEEPLVSVIIPTKDGLDILRQCLDGLFNKTDYSNFEVIIINNQSKERETHEYLASISNDARVKVINYDQPFNYSRINNIAVQKANGSILAFLNNDIEVINRDWLREMVSHAARPEIGAVGARLYYPDGTVQHAGVLLGYNGKAGHMYRYASPHWLGYWARGVLIQNLTAVTAACMVVRREVFEGVGGFDEKNLTITFNDVDLCIRIHQKGYRNLYTPYAELYHHESKTRGLSAIQSEEDYFAERWATELKNDSAYNPNLSLVSEDFSLSFPPRIRFPWIQYDITPGAKDAPLASIITRTHGDRQAFLKEALTSIFNQTYRPIQIVVVEDGGDSARATIEAITPPDGISIDYEPLPKRGRCYAGNRGLELAKGEVFGFLDDDDLLLPDHVESLIRHLYSNQYAAGAYSSSWEIPTEVVHLSPLKYIEGKKRLFGQANFSLSALWNYNYIAIQSFLLRKELYLTHGGFCEKLDCLEDWDLWLRYTAEKDFVFLDKPTSEFRTPVNEKVLSERIVQHMQYLPTLRNRQEELLDRYKNSPHHKRLQIAFDSIIV